jgi:type II secretory pathway pseudopilin PulG
MVAFIIMAVLSAVAIPSLIGVVGNDQLAADTTSAVSIVDAAYFNAQSEYGQTSPAVIFPITAAKLAAFVPAGTNLTFDATSCAIVVGEYSDCTYADPVPDIIFAFTNGDVVYVSAPAGYGDPSPTALGGTSPTGGTEGGGAGTTTTTAPTTTTSTTTTTTSTTTTTTTIPYVEASCTGSVVGPWANEGFATAFSMTCTGVTGAGVEASITVPGGILYVTVESADYWYGSGAPYASLPSTFTVSVTDQRATNPTDDTSPSAPYLYYFVFAAAGGGGFTYQPDNTVGQFSGNLIPDACLVSGTGCSTPSFTTSGFS